MFKYARTKEFEITIQPGYRFSEKIPVIGSNNVIVSRYNTTGSFSSGSSYLVYVYGSFDDVTYRQIFHNSGNNTGSVKEFNFNNEQNTTMSDSSIYVAAGFNYIKLYNGTSTNTATCTYKVSVII